ncbi:MAG: Ig-like domain-containing protein, partial [Treponema sp.]|nr:Ig-like domain-containing protein [Treponema sp.]
MIKRNLFVLFSIFMALFLASCDVGLGSAVDTEPPVLTIDYPQSGSIIKDSFILAGSCKDDVAVSKVEVVVKTQGSTSKVVGIYEADVDNKDNFWQVELNHFVESRESYNGWEYADGEYSIDVRAYDDASRVSGTSSISVKIDNTAPLLILKTPGNANIDAPTEYGTTVKIAGTIVDD